jgi:sugar lactone lactonase YvrE
MKYFLRGATQRVRAAAAIAAALAIFGIALPSLAEHTRFWRQSRYEEFQKGTAKGVAIRNDGRLFLAPKFTPFGDANLAYLWALRADSKGTLYAAGGSNAKVVKFDPQGKALKIFESPEMSAQALALDAHDNLYVGTSPDGKVYKVTPAGQSSVFFDPKTKYIWALEFGADGTLYVATGDTGKIFAVTPDGKGELFYASDEFHIRALAFDQKGNLIAGTEPNGRILRIPLAAPAMPKRSVAGDSASGGRRAFVVYETDKKEVTALQFDPSGNLYVSAIGEKPRNQQAIAPTPVPQQQAAPTLTFSSDENAPVNQPQQQVLTQAPAPSFAPFPTLTSSAVFRIAPDGSPEEVWSSREELVYSLGWSATGNLLMGTGNHGSILQLEPNRLFSQIAKTASEQVTGLAVGAGGAVYVATANPGKVFTLGPDDESQGTFESQAFDARIFSRWGRLTWWGEGQDAQTGGTRVELYARSGNTGSPDDNWSPWAGPYTHGSGDTVDCPPARFVQWKAVLAGGTGANAAQPQLEWVNLAYLPKNVAPIIGAVVLQEPGVRAQGINAGAGSSGQGPVPVQLRLPNAAAPPTLTFESGSGTGPGVGRFDAPPQGFRQKGYQAVLWSATDENDDSLEFSIYYRGEGESTWKLLKDKIEDRYYSWDTSTMPDGAYYLKIVASDGPSNPPDLALTAERESDRFLVDNTPPAIASFSAQPDPKAGPGAAKVHFEASDAGSAIARAQYSLDAGEWTLVLPGGEVSDSLQESYDFQLAGLTSGEHTVAVRVYDQFDNATSAKVTFSVGPEKR